MTLFDDLFGAVDTLLAPWSPVRAACGESEAAQPGDKDQLVLRSEAAFELGEGSYPSVSFALMTGSEALVPRDETLVYGPDLPALRKDTPFARVTLVCTDDIEAAGEQAAYEIMKGIELKKYDAAPRGYMVRASALTWREQVRVSKDAVRGGLTFAGVGALLAKTYRENPHVKAVKVIFITLPDGPYAPLERLASQSEERKKALNHVLADLKMDCRACEWKPVCDEVDGMKEMHQKYIREQNNGRESL